jgi:hypothetical protein
MKTGTKSVLFGAHCFFIHPWFVAWAWCRLYGFPLDPRLWVAFFTHDLGYWGKALMDDEDGETHPLLGAWIMGRLFDRKPYDFEWQEWSHPGKGVPWRFGTAEFNRLLVDGWEIVSCENSFTLLRRPRFHWYDFSLLHSRYYAKRLGLPFSRLCVADKLSFALTPAWLYLPMARLTGEIDEYLERSKAAVCATSNWPAADYSADVRLWHANLCRYMREWVDAHKDGAQDTWTSNDRHAKKPDTSGS